MTLGAADLLSFLQISWKVYLCKILSWICVKHAMIECQILKTAAQRKNVMHPAGRDEATRTQIYMNCNGSSTTSGQRGNALERKNFFNH